MGLDMYLIGHKFIAPFEKVQPLEDGFEIASTNLRLGYWRKHPNLHGYIVQKYAGGKDDCQAIELGYDELSDILKATIEDRLPETSGFFFGASVPEDKDETIVILKRAIAWLAQNTDGTSFKTVSYRASW